MRAEQGGKVLGECAAALGRIVDESEGMLLKIQRSHRLKVAEEEVDVLGLAGLLGFVRADFLILSRLYEKGLLIARGENETERTFFKKYRTVYVDQLRRAVQRLGALMQDGCGSIWALLEGTAILINADLVKEEGNVVIEHPDRDADRGGFVHRVKVAYPALKEDSNPPELVRQQGYIYLVENPLRDNKTDDRDRDHLEKFRIERRGFFPAEAAVQITGMGERTVWPMVVNRSTGEGVGFRGVVPHGKKLLISSDGRGVLDGVEVTGQCY